MTLMQLQYFKMLAKNLHYTRTAEALHISQPSLSYSINELEKELGVNLFEKKNNRKISLTPYGEAFLPYVEKALFLLQEGSGVVSQMVSAADRTVRLGYLHSLSSSIVPVMVSHFYSSEDNGPTKPRFQFTEGPSHQLIEMLERGELDLVFSMTEPQDWMESIPIMRQPLYLAVPSDHPLADRRLVSFEDFAREPQIMLGRSSHLRTTLDHIYGKRGIIPNVAFEVFGCNTALQYVGLEFGVAVLPQVPAMDTEKVSIIPISDKGHEFSRTIYISWSRSRPITPAARQLRDFIVDNYGIFEQGHEEQ